MTYHWSLPDPRNRWLRTETPSSWSSSDRRAPGWAALPIALASPLLWGCFFPKLLKPRPSGWTGRPCRQPSLGIAAWSEKRSKHSVIGPRGNGIPWWQREGTSPSPLLVFLQKQLDQSSLVLGQKEARNLKGVFLGEKKELDHFSLKQKPD